MRLSLLPVAVFATSVLADGASILGAIASIANSTIALNTTVASFPPGIKGLADIIPLLVASTDLLHDINSATDVAKASANLTLTEAIQIAQATISLSTTVNSTITTVIRAKPKFDKLLIVSPVVLLNLKLEKDATEKLGTAVVAKVPVNLQPLAQSLLKPIDDSFVEGIAAYD